MRTMVAVSVCAVLMAMSVSVHGQTSFSSMSVDELLDQGGSYAKVIEGAYEEAKKVYAIAKSESDPKKLVEMEKPLKALEGLTKTAKSNLEALSKAHSIGDKKTMEQLVLKLSVAADTANKKLAEAKAAGGPSVQSTDTGATMVTKDFSQNLPKIDESDYGQMLASFSVPHDPDSNDTEGDEDIPEPTITPPDEEPFTPFSQTEP